MDTSKDRGLLIEFMEKPNLHLGENFTHRSLPILGLAFGVSPPPKAADGRDGGQMTEYWAEMMLLVTSWLTYPAP